MMDFRYNRAHSFILCILFLSLALSECTTTISRKKPTKETNIFNFFRLIIFRMIYGFASMLGAQEVLSEFMGGIFVPPGSEDADYRDYLDGEDKDYDYDYRSL